jgi:cyclase
MKRGMVLSVLFLIGSLSIAISGYQGPPAAGQGAPPAGGGGRGGGGGQGRGAPVPLNTIKVRDNLYMIANGGGNTAVFIMANGVALVDTKNPNNGQLILDQVRTVTPKPITMVINTHTHADHTGSNEFFNDNVRFVAHEKTKANMVKMTNFAGEKAAFLPSQVYSDTLSIGSGPDQILLYYFGRAHTDGDSFVVFPALRVMHTGDAFPNKGFPFVDDANGGSTVEYGKTLAKAAAVRNVDTIINGHVTTGPNPFTDLQVYADFINEMVAWVEAQIAAGKTADQAATEYTVPAKYTALGFTGGARGAANIRIAYRELGK